MSTTPVTMATHASTHTQRLHAHTQHHPCTCAHSSLHTRAHCRACPASQPRHNQPLLVVLQVGSVKLDLMDDLAPNPPQHAHESCTPLFQPAAMAVAMAKPGSASRKLLYTRTPTPAACLASRSMAAKLSLPFPAPCHARASVRMRRTAHLPPLQIPHPRRCSSAAEAADFARCRRRSFAVRP